MNKVFSKRGFTFIELLGALLIIGVLTLIGFFAIQSAISSANKTRVQSDFQEMESVISLVLFENSNIQKATGYQPKSVLKIFKNDDYELSIDFSHCGNDDTLRNGNSEITSLKEITSKTVVSTSSIDPWGTPYKMYVQGNDLKATGEGSEDTELRIFVISNGENRIGSDKPNLLDADDLCMLVESVNGKVRTGFYNLDVASKEKIHWFRKDTDDFSTNEVFPDGASSVLNMNYACLEPKTDDK